MAVFIDSCVFVAYANPDDSCHKEAEKTVTDIVMGKYGPAFTSDYVFDETVTVVLARMKDTRKSTEFGRYLLSSEATMLWVDEIIFRQAWAIFEGDNPGRMSFTDCTTSSIRT